MPASTPAPRSRPDDDADAIVVGAGHNGLITAAYLARAGLRTILLEARADVGGTAASERFAGATVNICNCDHTTFRTTPVIAELELARFGLRYLDVEPSGHQMAWSGGPAWSAHHSLERTLDSLRSTYPDEVERYERYASAAIPAARLILAAAAEPPSARGLTRRALRARLAGVPTLLRWSRRSAADVLRDHFRHDALLSPAVVTGPMVWGISPETPGSGLGALTYAMRHVGTVGRPIGGSGMVPTSILAAFEHHGGVLRTKSEVDTILCEGDHVRGVALVDGTELRAGIVVSACNPHDTFLRWLKHPPAAATDLVRRWRDVPHAEGYESKIDAVLTEPPRVRAVGGDIGATLTVGPTLADIDRGARLMASGEVLDRPALLVNVPSLLDPTMAPEGDGPARHVFSLEALFTPYRVQGGWPGSPEPWRWLERFADLCEPGFLDSIVEWRAMTPDVYEREFFLPAGHATSFGGGPLAAFRNKDPELTRYETSVGGLYLTGAATFPGAGVWGASGKNCATVVLSHARADADV